MLETMKKRWCSFRNKPYFRMVTTLSNKDKKTVDALVEIDFNEPFIEFLSSLGYDTKDATVAATEYAVNCLIPEEELMSDDGEEEVF